MRKGEATRQAILDEAVHAARHTGLSGLTIGTLAERTGLSKSGLYAHFRSKEALQLDTMRHNREQFIGEVLRSALASPRGEARLRTLVARWIRWYHHPGGCLFLASATEFDDFPGPLHDQMVSDVSDLQDSLTQIIDTLVSTGDVRADTDTDQVAQEVLGILLAFNWAWRFLKHDEAERRAWTALDRLLTSLRPDES
ncbi:TetR family transcriptional regulator [Stackebrandtia albiflava]|uniref:TetR family transcriptional regulator n=1 Tax=Stackebrandtia albiflava TaxID=406432 RepID=A0A562URY4_9ACTN|nr:TetR/AcrR family transcriptional regulator [Stackebrandtia albiflava]TWJ08370.1 TetR family transcriptional regulator [Stackebrandtia albiflava]